MSMNIDIGDITQRLNEFNRKGEMAADMFCETASKKFEAYAKEHRPWKDRSGAARRRLKGSWNKTHKGRNIEIAHGVDYGIYLEKAHEERYAILQPTIDHYSPEVMRGWNKLIERT